MRFDRLNISSRLVKNAETLQDRGTKRKKRRERARSRMPNVHLYLMACYFHWPGDVINHPDRQRHREGADRARIRCFGLKECLVRLLRPTEIRISIIESTDRGGVPRGA